MKCIIQSHHPQRQGNLKLIVQSLYENGLKYKDILLLIDYPVIIEDPFAESIISSHSMPINWRHSVASILDTDYVLCLDDDIALKPKSIKSLLKYAYEKPDIDVFGFEGSKFNGKMKPYTGGEPSHTVEFFEPCDYVIRCYFARPEAYARALSLYNKYPYQPIEDDLFLALSNKCGIVPTTSSVGFTDLPEYKVAFSNNGNHLAIRDELVRRLK
jgi:hypothetical protein